MSAMIQTTRFVLGWWTQARRTSKRATRKLSNYNGRNRIKNLANIIVLLYSLVLCKGSTLTCYSTRLFVGTLSMSRKARIRWKKKGLAAMNVFIVTLKGNLSILGIDCRLDSLAMWDGCLYTVRCITYGKWLCHKRVLKFTHTN